MNVPFIGVGGGDDTDINAAFRCRFQGSDKLVIQNEVGGGDVDIAAAALNEMLIGIFRYIKMIQRSIGERLDEALRRDGQGGEIFRLRVSKSVILDRKSVV